MALALIALTSGWSLAVAGTPATTPLKVPGAQENSWQQASKAATQTFDPMASLLQNDDELRLTDEVSLAPQKVAPMSSTKGMKGILSSSRQKVGTAPHKAAQAPVGGYIAKDRLSSGSLNTYAMSLVQEDGQYYMQAVYGLDDKVSITINLKAGTVSIPAQKLYTHNTYGDLWIYPVEVNDTQVTYYPQGAVSGTIDENGVITLDAWGVIGATGNYSGTVFSLTSSSQWIPANGHVTATDRDDKTLEWDVLIEQNKDNNLVIYNFASLGEPVNVRLTAGGRVVISTQYVTSIGIYGAFYCYKANYTTNQINTTDPIEGTGTATTLSIGSWALGALMQPTTTALRIKEMEITCTTSITFPEAQAANFEGDGTKASPYLIKTATDLIALSQSVASGNAYLNRYFRQVADIDMGTVSTNFQPIGDRTTLFEGNYDGNNHTISNLDMDGQGFNYVGLFGVCSINSSIVNVNLSDAKLTGGGSYIAPLVGYTIGLVQNCHVTGNVVGTGVGIGGVVGMSYAGTIDGCTFSGNVSGYGYTGGIVGYSYGPISNCSSDASVTINGIIRQAAVCVGGIAGLTQSYSTAREGVIIHCYFSGTVTQAVGYGFAGGISGYVYACKLSQCFNVGNVVTTSTTGDTEGAGGLFGIINDSQVDNCFNAGTVQEYGKSTFAGGLVGYITCTYSSGDGMSGASTFSNCYNSGDVIAFNRTEHAGLYGDEFIHESFDERPSDVAFNNVFTDNQMTGLDDEARGRNTTFFTGGTLPEGFSSAIWSSQANFYPVLKSSAGTAAAQLAAASILFADGESVRVMKTAATLHATGNGKWTLRQDGQNVNETSASKIDGGTLSIKDIYANNTLAVYDDDSRVTRYYVVTIVPKVFEGEGTEQLPFLIKNKADFILLDKAIRNYDHRGDYFKLANDIDFNYATDFGGVAASNDLRWFAGTFDGDNHTLSRLRVKAVNLAADGTTLEGTFNYGGLFHMGAKTSCIKNLKLAADCEFNLYDNGGTIIGYTEGRVENCYNYAPIKVAGNNTGGIAGYVTANGMVSGCYNAGEISVHGHYVGGIVGYNEGIIELSENDANVDARGSRGHVGGIAGVSSGSVDRCVNNGHISGLDYVGGLLGASAAASGQGNITGNVSNGSIAFDTGAAYMGGIVAYVSTKGVVSNNYYDASILTNGPCANLASGMTGLSSSEMVSGTAWNGFDAADWSFASDAYPVLKKFAAEEAAVALRSTFVKFAKNVIHTNLLVNTPLASSDQIEWTLGSGTHYAIADGMLTVNLPQDDIAADTLTAIYAGRWTKVIPLKSIPNILDGAGTAGEPFAIRTVADLNKLATFIENSGMEYDGYYFRVENDIAYTESDTTMSISTGNLSFQGNFDGNGKTISGFNLENTDRTAGKKIGFFCTVGSKGRVHDLTLDGTVNGYQYVGGFVGRLYGTLENCVSRNNIISSSTYVGGLVSEAFEGALIANCRNQGNVQTTKASNYIGGVVAKMYAGSVVDNCVNEGNVGYLNGTQGTQYVAGIVASCDGTVKNCVNTKPIEGRMNKAGICAYSETNDTIINCVNTADLSSTLSYLGGIVANSKANARSLIKNCYNTGKMEGASYTAGVVAYVNSGMTIDSCYNKGEIVGTSFGVGGVVGQGGSSSATAPIVISNCYNEGNISSTSFSCGGLAGKTGSLTVTYCYNTGRVTVNKTTVSATDSGVGGLIGSFCGSVDNSWNSGQVTSNVQGTGGLIGTGAMPVAYVNRCANLGDVIVTNVQPTRNYNVGGIWGGYGPCEITNSYNMGTLTAPGNSGGINGALHSNSNGGSTVVNCFNAGKIVTTAAGENNGISPDEDTDSGCANIAAMGYGVDASLMNVENCYYDNSVGNDVWPADTLATGLASKDLFATQISDDYVIQRACYPTLVGFQEVIPANFAAASVELQEGDTFYNVAHAFFVGMPLGVTWTASDNLSIAPDGTVNILATGEGWVKAGDNAHWNLEKIYNLNLSGTTGIATVGQYGKLVVSHQYYALNGRKVTAPEQGAMVIVKITYDDGTATFTKQFYRN